MRSFNGTAGAPLSTRAARLVSKGWAAGHAPCLDPADAADIRGAVGTGEHRDLAFTGPDGYRHAVGVLLDAAAVRRLLDDDRLGSAVADGMATSDLWLGAVEALAAPDGGGWHRELADARRATGSSAFRPGLSVLVTLDQGAQVAVHEGSHRLLGEPSGEPPAVASVASIGLGRGDWLLVEGGCRVRLRGWFLHLRLIRSWMKPDVLLAGPLGGHLADLGEQGRRWCGADSGLPASIEEFLDIEERALAGGLAQRKGSGI